MIPCGTPAVSFPAMLIREAAYGHLCPAAQAVVVLASARTVSVSGWP